MSIHWIGLTLATLAALMPAGPVFAALAPHYQRAEEIRAILAETYVVDAFDGAAIDKVEYIETDLYRVTAGSCWLDVAIADKQPASGLLGPRQIEVKPGAPSCS